MCGFELHAPDEQLMLRVDRAVVVNVEGLIAVWADLSDMGRRSLRESRPTVVVVTVSLK